MNRQKKLTREGHKLSESLGYIVGCALKGLDDEELRENVTQAIQSGGATGTLVVVADGKVLELDLFGDGVVPFAFRVK